MSDIGDVQSLLGRKIVRKKGLEEGIDLDSVGVFQSHRIQKPLLDVPMNGTGRNMKQLCRFFDGQAMG